MSGPDTGRLVATVSRRTQRIVYGEPAPAEIADELRWTSTVDLAHVLMLLDRKLVEPAEAARLLDGIARLRAVDFRPVTGRPAPRGLYLAYEQYLIETLGADVGGRLHTGRSRNDLKATTTALRLRAELVGLAGELVRLMAVLLSRARAHRDVVMPVHTHFQAALPMTYGYYLTGVALAVGRDLAAVTAAADELRRCPLGAGAVAGTDLPIDPARTAALLGFAAPPAHALDAIASRDTPLRALAAAVVAGLTLSRLATDLQLWSTAEFGYVTFPDRLVSGSSAMPQKRNAFLLEHVKGRSAVATGAWTAAASATRSTPFSNAIEVGTEAVGSVWPGLRAVLDAVQLAQSLVSGARPVPDRMLRGARDGFVTATARANRLVLAGVPFRTAHSLVGAAVRKAVAAGRTRLTGPEPDGCPRPDPPLADLVAAQRAGGGPGAFGDAFREARAEYGRHEAWCRATRDRLRRADEELAAEVRAAIGPSTGDGRP
jgi:argininosuccinate lyase